MKFHVYDRMENGKFVPNGYPLDYEYIKDPTEYKTKFQKEKTVHWMGYNLIGEINREKLSSEVEDNFIYPVEQFGAFEKLIGEGNLGVDLIQISQVDIESPEFRKHVTKLHNEYQDVLKPVALLLFNSYLYSI